MRTTENHVDITGVSIHMSSAHRREVTTTINTMRNRRRTSIDNGSSTQQDIGFGHFHRVGQVGITTTTTGRHSGFFHIGIGFATDNIFGIVRLRSDIHKSIAYQFIAFFGGNILESRTRQRRLRVQTVVGVQITTIRTTINTFVNITTQILYIRLRTHLLFVVAHPEMIANDLSTKVVTTEHGFGYVGKTLAIIGFRSDISRCITIDICVTSTCESSFHTTTQKLQRGVSANFSGITTGINSVSIQFIAGQYQIFVQSNLGITKHFTHLTTTESQENTGIFVQVDSRITLDSRICTITTAINSQGAGIHIIAGVGDRFRIKIGRNQIVFNADMHITNYHTTIVATTIDIGAGVNLLVVINATVEILINDVVDSGARFQTRTNQKLYLGLTVCIADKTTRISSIMITGKHIGAITTGYNFIVDSNALRKFDVYFVVGHTTYVTTAVE